MFGGKLGGGQGVKSYKSKKKLNRKDKVEDDKTRIRFGEDKCHFLSNEE